MGADLVLAIDQGTSSTRTIAFDRSLRVVASAGRPVRTTGPRPGWAEQDPVEIESSVVESVAEVLDAIGGRKRISAVGLANPGETVIAWDARTAAPLAPAVTWSCRRSEAVVARLRSSGIEPDVRQRTGLPLDAYFSAGKATWLLENVAPVAAAARRGWLRVGTVDAWLTARLGDRGGLTDPSTASRTQLLSLASVDWDAQLLDWFGLRREMLPRIVPTVGDAGAITHPTWGGSLSLAGLACDQQAALAGHTGFEAGSMKATYGTGVFVLANSGRQVDAVDGLERSLAWDVPGLGLSTVLQGGVFAAGSLIDWLCDPMHLIGSSADSEPAARRVADTAGVRVLPAPAGLGSPHYDHDARAVVAGLTTASTPDHVVRAALDGIAHRTADVVEAIIAAVGASPPLLRVDGGLSTNAYLMERQADYLGLPVEITSFPEATALGMASLVAIGLGRASTDEVRAARPSTHRVQPQLPRAERLAERAAWHRFATVSRDLSGDRRQPLLG